MNTRSCLFLQTRIIYIDHPRDFIIQFLYGKSYPMPDKQPENTHKTKGDSKISWICTVCGFLFTGEKPPKGCPVCHSPAHEFILQKEQRQLTYDGEPFDVLLINGSTHRAGNTGYMLDLAEAVLQKRGVSYRRFNISEYTIDYCWCCYAVRAESCTFPCRNNRRYAGVLTRCWLLQRQLLLPPRSTGTACQFGSRPSLTGQPAWRTFTISANPA